MDYGFAPGGKDPAMGRLRNFFSHRSQTTLVQTNAVITPKSIATVEEFLGHLNAEVTPLPVGSMLVGSHASTGGTLLIPMFRDGTQAITPTRYETLDLAVSNNAIRIPSAVVGNPPTGTHYFHIKGCNIGKAPAFLQRLRTALGDNVTVTAPKHFYGISNTINLRHVDIGIFEFLCYEFSVRTPKPVDDSDALVAKFISASHAPATQAEFNYVNGTHVPDSKWSAWIPQTKNMTKIRHANLTIRDSNKAMVAGTLKTPVGDIKSLLDVMQPVKKRQKNIDPNTWPFVLRAREEAWAPSLTYASKSQVPTGVDAQQQALKDFMRNAANFQATHAFPVYIRLGYQSFADFYAGLTWVNPSVTFSKKLNKWILAGKGVHMKYTLVIPITDPTSSNIDPFVDGVLTNYYAVSSSFTSHTQLPEPGTTGVPQSEIERYFASV